MGFSSKLTEEEEFLKKKYVILRKKKKILQQLRSKRKQEEAEASETGPSKKKRKKVSRSISESVKPSGPNKNEATARIRNISSFDAAANTEAAKELIKSGALKLKSETKTIFKRSLAKKKRDEPGKKLVFQPFNPSGASSSDQNEESSPTKAVSEQRQNSGNSSGKSTTNNHKEGFNNRFSKENRKFDRSTPRRGNTIYIHGYDLSISLLEEQFTEFGKIIKVDIEPPNNKSGFITFNSFEAAENAIEKMNDAMVAGTRLKVSLARRQKMLESAVSSSVWAPLVVSHSDKGPTNVKEKRALVVYDDDFFSDD